MKWEGKKRRVNCWVQYQICKIVIFGMRYGNVIAVPIRLHAWTTEKYHIAFRRRTLVNWMKQRAWMSCYYREFVWSYIYRSDSIKCNKCSWKKNLNKIHSVCGKKDANKCELFHLSAGYQEMSWHWSCDVIVHFSVLINNSTDKSME